MAGRPQSRRNPATFGSIPVGTIFKLAPIAGLDADNNLYRKEIDARGHAVGRIGKLRPRAGWMPSSWTASVRAGDGIIVVSTGASVKSNPQAPKDEFGGWKATIKAGNETITLPLGGGSYGFNRGVAGDAKGTLRRLVGGGLDERDQSKRVVIHENHRADGVVSGYTAVMKEDQDEVVGTARISRGGVAPGAKKKLPGAGAGAALSNPRPSRQASASRKANPARNSKGQFVKNPKRRSR